MLKLSGESEYLTFFGTGKARRISIRKSKPDSKQSVGPEFRISPIFPAVKNAFSAPVPFSGTWNLLFFGPTAPDTASQFVLKSDHYWLTFGLLNNIVASRNGNRFRQLCNLLRQREIPHDWLLIKNGVIVRRIGRYFPIYNSTPFDLHADSNMPPELAWTLSELEPLLLALSTRAVPIKPELEDVIKDYSTQIAAILEKAQSNRPYGVNRRTARHSGLLRLRKETTDDGYFDAHADLQKINTGLSRFAAQLCVCIPPLEQYECHYWAHSALGLGTAVLGLLSLVQHIYDAIATKHIPERFAALCNERFPSKVFDSARDSYRFDLSDHEPQIENGANDRPMFSLPYFSGRDGFQSNAYSVSAPITSIAAATNIRWALPNLTHELSHDIIGGVLSANLVPARPGRLAQAKIREAISEDPKDSVGAYIRRKFLLAVLAFRRHPDVIGETSNPVPNADLPIFESDPTTMAGEIDRLLDEVLIDIEEIMVHAFDFLYFYRSQPEPYVRTIWSSWATIPEVRRRIPKYVIRTICALSLHPDALKSDQFAYKTVLSILGDMKSSNNIRETCDFAIHYLRSFKLRVLRDATMQWPMADIVQRYLFSAEYVNHLHGDPGQVDKFSALQFDEKALRNPLAFTRRFGGALDQVSQARSAWLYSCLAHSYVRNTNGA